MTNLMSLCLLRQCTLISFLAIFVRAVPNKLLCGQYEKLADPSNTYIFENDAWGLDASGSSCVTVANNATSFSSTWSWKANDTSVHAFPHINYNPIQEDPIQISNLSSIDAKMSWSMQPTTGASASSLDTSGLAKVNAKANVAFDMFFDTNKEKAVNSTAPSVEVMVWIGTVGSIVPIGATNVDHSKLPKQKVGKQTFTLYQGHNDNGQYVFSWIASSNMTSFEGDISPLVHYLWRNGLMLVSNYIGVLQFGTEQQHATSNVTFSVNDFSISARQGTPNGAAGASCKLSWWNLMCVLAIILFVALA